MKLRVHECTRERFIPGECTPRHGSLWIRRSTMPYTLEISDELKSRLDKHREEGETYEELIAELVTLYETEGTFLQEGYSE